MPKPYQRALCWVRRDLRLYDHRPLAEACAQANEVALVFILDTQILSQLKDQDDRRITFIVDSLQEMDDRLRQQGSGLIVLHGDPVDLIPDLAERFQADAVFTGKDYEPLAKARDAEVAKRLSHSGKQLQLVKDQVIFEAGEILNQSGQPFRVFTPYSKVWKTNLNPTRDAADWTPNLEVLTPIDEWKEEWSLEKIGFRRNDLWLTPGEAAGRKRLADFSDQMSDYAETRDFPAQSGTSGLSVHLRFGTVSIRDCVRCALDHHADKWLTELVWREFYQDILAHNPNVLSETYQEPYRNLEYPGTEDHWVAWCEGKTGFPIVDAAMRCFNATGWMHNRLRMIVASFLTKDLLLDYRKGEAYFARFLLDFDLASNNGGWQWAASTGVDAQPYFRIFNPILQSQKFDPEGRFLRAWLPELKELSNDDIHWPHEVKEFDLLAAGIALGDNYPHPIVNHSVQRDLAVKLLESARRS